MGQVVRDWNEYRIVMKDTESYTLIPRSILSYAVTASCFVVMLYLYSCAGREGHAYPSIRHMAGKLKDRESGCGVSKASVCRALQLMKKLKFFIKLFCKTLRGDYACNTYLLTDMVTKHRRQETACQDSESEAQKGQESCELLPIGGSLKISIPPWNKNVTKGYILRERDKGVFQFSKMYKIFDLLRRIPFLSKYIPRPPTTDVPALE